MQIIMSDFASSHPYMHTRPCGKHMENENTNNSESDFNSIPRS